MSFEPKVIDHPGAGKIQEMSLDQYLGLLSPDHLARKQLDEIRSQALKAVEISTQLMQANEKIMDLQNKLILGAQVQPIIAPSPTGYSTGDPVPPPNITVCHSSPPPADPSKFVCEVCGKALNSITGLQRHLQFKHQANFRIKGHQLVPVPPQ